MLLGIISDVHANIVALDAVFEHFKKHAVDQVICLGDLVGYGPSPNEVIERIRSERVLCTLGEADERIAFRFTGHHRKREGVADDTLEWTSTVIEPQNLSFLRHLPVQARLRTSVGRLRYFHSSMYSPSERLNLDVDVESLQKVLRDHRCNILVTGKTHVPAIKRLGTGWIINPGSVGLSLNGEPGADYALLKVEGGKVEINMDKVEYDYAAVAFDILAWDLPEIIAEAIQLGRMPVSPDQGTKDPTKIRIHNPKEDT